MSQILGLVFGAVFVLAYAWGAAYVWHILPDAKEWWTFPAQVTTLFMAAGSLFGGVCFGVFLGVKIEND